MTPPHLNALNSVTIKAEGLTLIGFSISALATWLVVPELDVCFDMGECPLEALKMNHVFLTHVHGDHVRCLPRHWQIRKMFGRSEGVYYVPQENWADIRGWIRAEAKMEGVAEVELPQLVGTVDQVESSLPYRRDLWVRAFKADHRVPSLGYTIGRTRRKLIDALNGIPGAEIAARKDRGEVIDREVRTPLLTFIGDCSIETLRREEHVWDSPILVVECTYIEEGEEELAERGQHTTLGQIAEVLREKESSAVKKLILKHFSMRYEPPRIRERVAEAVPLNWRSRVKILLP